MTQVLRYLIAILQILNSGTPLPDFPTTRIEPKNPEKTISFRVIDSDSVTSTASISQVELHGLERTWTTITGHTKNDTATFRISSSTPQYLSIKSIFNRSKEIRLLLEPGDNITFHIQAGKIEAIGPGSEKHSLLTKIQDYHQSVKRPSNPKDYTTKSIEDYIEWNTYLNTLLTGKDSILLQFKTKLSKFAYSLLKAQIIDQIIDDRSDKFHSLVFGLARTQMITPSDLCKIYDSLYFPAVNEGFQYCTQIIYGNWKPLLFKTLREHNFDRSQTPLNSKYQTWTIIYKKGLKQYAGLIREQFTIDFLYKHLLKEFGFQPELEILLKEYYATSQSVECKQYLIEKEANLRRIINSDQAPLFELDDIAGNKITNSKFQNKIVVLDFWFTGCAGCIPLSNNLQIAETYYKNDSNIIFVKINIDKDRNRWIESIKNEKYTKQSGLHLYTQGQEDKHSFITKMGITSYPTLMFIDPFGRVLFPQAQHHGFKDNADSLIQYIKTIREKQNDGPYLFRQGRDSILNVSVHFNKVDSTISSKKDQFRTYTSFPTEYFSFKLNDNTSKEASYYTTPSKIFAISDIEGNFAAFITLLNANQIIDTNLNWSFEKGHLVICGDVFDRGEQVTECLWLIYHLEQQAKEQGGYVHFIIGNHEVMNIQGNNSYTQPKYKQLYTPNRKNHFFDQSSILGQWIRTKNIIEQIGSLIFVHGGLGLEFTNQVKTRDLREINLKFQEFIDRGWDNIPSNDSMTTSIFHPGTGPLWYRQYYKESERLQLGKNAATAFSVEHPTLLEFNNLLKTWHASKIITGHTIISDTISSHYDFQLINLDTKHSDGKSEALLIDSEIYYRTNDKGIRYRLIP